MADEKRDYGAKRAKTPAHPKEAAIHHIDGQVKTQVFVDGFFQGGHAVHFTTRDFLWRRGSFSNLPLEKFNAGYKIKHKV